LLVFNVNSERKEEIIYIITMAHFLSHPEMYHKAEYLGKNFILLVMNDAFKQNG